MRLKWQAPGSGTEKVVTMFSATGRHNLRVVKKSVHCTSSNGTLVRPRSTTVVDHRPLVVWSGLSDQSGYPGPHPSTSPGSPKEEIANAYTCHAALLHRRSLLSKTSQHMATTVSAFTARLWRDNVSLFSFLADNELGTWISLCAQHATHR